MQIKGGSLSDREAFSRGFDRGNYGNAYESQDWQTWFDRQDLSERDQSDAYCSGMVLGFFSSYELNEIADEEMCEIVAQLRADFSGTLPES
jgi:hypothetical protein